MKIFLKFLILFSLLYLTFYLVPFSNFKPDEEFYKSEDKLWMHRMLDPNNNDNSKEFPGYELDVFFNKVDRIFEVRHHGEEFKYTLDSYFSEFKSMDGKFFWIDFKNLDSVNMNESLSQLTKVVEKYNIKGNIIVESKEIDVLIKFKNNNFAISYWLPDFHFFGVLTSSFIVRSNIIKYRPTALSCDFNSLHFYLKKFPNYTFHCWVNNLNSKGDQDLIRELSRNTNINIILTDFKNNFLINH